MRDERRLMAHWCESYPDSIRSIRYEELVAAPQPTIAGLAAWVGMPSVLAPATDTPTNPTSTINTASLWQARQPVHTKSVKRWEHYVPYVPELSSLSDT